MTAKDAKWKYPGLPKIRDKAKKPKSNFPPSEYRSSSLLGKETNTLVSKLPRSECLPPPVFLKPTNTRDFDHPELIGRLYGCCALSYKELVKAARKNDQIRNNQLEILQSQYQVLCLWGDDFNTSSGALDKHLAKSKGLMTLTLSILCSLTKAILEGLRHVPTSKDKSLFCELGVQTVLYLVERELHLDDTTDDESINEDDAFSFEEMLEDIKAYTENLLDLIPSIECPAEDPLKGNPVLGLDPMQRIPSYDPRQERHDRDLKPIMNTSMYNSQQSSTLYAPQDQYTSCMDPTGHMSGDNIQQASGLFQREQYARDQNPIGVTSWDNGQEYSGFYPQQEQYTSYLDPIEYTSSFNNQQDSASYSQQEQYTSYLNLNHTSWATPQQYSASPYTSDPKSISDASCDSGFESSRSYQPLDLEPQTTGLFDTESLGNTLYSDGDLKHLELPDHLFLPPDIEHYLNHPDQPPQIFSGLQTNVNTAMAGLSEHVPSSAEPSLGESMSKVVKLYRSIMSNQACSEDEVSEGIQNLETIKNLFNSKREAPSLLLNEPTEQEQNGNPETATALRKKGAA